MIKFRCEKIRRAASIALLSAIAAVVMMFAVGCQDSNIIMKEERDRQLINADGEAWAIVCASTSSSTGCLPKATRAIAFKGDGTAIVYEVSETSWKRYTQVRWSTNGDILYITYSTGAVRYSFGTSDGLLTIRAEKAVSGLSAYLTDGGTIAGFEKTEILPEPHQVMLSASAGGTLSVTTADATATPISSGTEVSPGTVLRVTATPKGANYGLASLTVNGLPFENGGTYTVEGVTTIAATFSVPVKYVQPAGGMLEVKLLTGDTVAADAKIPVGTDIRITAMPSAEGYTTTITANGQTVTNGDTYTVRDSVTIAATFTSVSHTVTFSNPVNGTLSVMSGSTAITTGAKVPEGSTLNITATPNDGYVLTGLTVNGVTYQGNVPGFTVQGAVSISATFAVRTNRVTISSNAGGTLSVTANGAPVSNNQMVPNGTVLNITATPNVAGYVLHSLTVNGQAVSSGYQHTVTGDVVVVATFSDPAAPTYSASFTQTGGGTLSVKRQDNDAPVSSGDQIPSGTIVIITATPDAGNSLSALTVNGTSFTSGNPYTVTGAFVVDAKFAAPVTYSQPTGGTLSVKRQDNGADVPSGTMITMGTILNIIAAALPGYELQSVTVNGVTFPMGTTQHIVTGPVTASAGVGVASYTGSYPSSTPGGTLSVKRQDDGSVIPSGTPIPNGTVVIITATALTDYTLSSLTVNGTPHISGQPYTVNGAFNVSVQFTQSSAAVTHQVSYPTNPQGGTLSVKRQDNVEIPSGATVPVGTVVIITATASSGYQLSALTVNGNAYTSGTPYTVTGALNIAVSFGQKGVEDAGGSLQSTNNPTPVTADEQERYDRYYRQYANNKDAQFSDLWWLTNDENDFEYDGTWYTGSGVFAPNGEYWQVAIPLISKNGNINYDLPAKYIKVGTYNAVGNRVHVDIPEAGLANIERSQWGTFTVSGDRETGRTMTIVFDSDSREPWYFEELRCMIFILDLNLVQAMVDSGIFD